MSDYYRRLRTQVGTGLLMVPSVAAVIHDEAGRLCLQRNGEGYSLPAGAIEPGEAPEDALRREVHEETGLDVVNSKLLGLFGGNEFRHKYPNGDAVEYFVALYRCTVTGTVAPQDDETIAVEWHTTDALPALAMPWPPELLRR